VVVAIIALLIGVLLPALGKARESARRNGCLSNTRQLVIYCSLYAEDYEDWYPVLPPPPTGQPGVQFNVRIQAPTVMSAFQHRYGGLAGLFSLKQFGANSAFEYRQNRYREWNQATNLWEFPTDNESPPLLSPYADTGGDFGVLQCPSDALDGGENGALFPQVVPKRIGNERDVSWNNISFLYVALLKRTEQRPFFLFADETNSSDVGNSTGGVAIPNWTQTWRLGATDPGLKGFQTVDNHGETGGNFSFTDGSAQWIRQLRPTSGTGPLEPHDRLFGEIGRFHRGGTTTVQTID
jgi:hypothetical protein